MTARMILRTLLLALASSLLACSGTAADEDIGDTTDEALSAKDDSARADLATDRLLRRFWNDRRDYLDGESPSNGKDAGYWIYAQAFDAVLDEVDRTGGAKMKPEIARLHDAQARRGFTREFFDDENWMALALVRASTLTGDRRYLDQAIALGDDILEHGWVAGKGVWWNKTHTQRATASNFGPVILAQRLFVHTRDAKWERMAKEVYENWLSKMVNPTTHEVADHVDPGMKPVWVNYTYNYGLAIGASLAMHELTGNAAYLAHAHAFAAYMLAHRTEKNVLDDGEGCKNDCDAFKGIGFRYLAALYESDRSHAEYRAVLDASAAAIWADARERSSTTFGSSWTRRASGPTTLAADASAVMALNLVVRVDL